MDKTISATEARIHFGELIQEAQNQPITIERDGKPVVVVISKQEYDEMMLKGKWAAWRVKLEEAHRLIKAELGDRELPDPDEVLHEIREERAKTYDEYFKDMH